MKFNAVATVASAALLAGVAHADETVESAVAPELPTFTVSHIRRHTAELSLGASSPRHTSMRGAIDH